MIDALVIVPMSAFSVCVPAAFRYHVPRFCDTAATPVVIVLASSRVSESSTAYRNTSTSRSVAKFVPLSCCVSCAWFTPHAGLMVAVIALLPPKRRMFPGSLCEVRMPDADVAFMPAEANGNTRPVRWCSSRMTGCASNSRRTSPFSGYHWLSVGCVVAPASPNAVPPPSRIRIRTNTVSPGAAVTLECQSASLCGLTAASNTMFVVWARAHDAAVHAIPQAKSTAATLVRVVHIPGKRFEPIVHLLRRAPANPSTANISPAAPGPGTIAAFVIVPIGTCSPSVPSAFIHHAVLVSVKFDASVRSWRSLRSLALNATA